MDLWLAITVTGTRYFAENWKSLVKKGEEDLSQPFRRVLTCNKSKLVSLMDRKIDRKRVESGSGIFRRFIWNQVEGDVSFNNHKASSDSVGRSLKKQVDSPLEGVAYSSASSVDTLMSSVKYVRDHSSLLSLQPWIFRKEKCQSDEGMVKVNGESSGKCGYELNGFTDASQAEHSPRSVSLGYGLGRGRSSLRSRRSRRCSVKPLTSMENCLIPQLYNEQFDIGEYVCSSVPSSTATTVRPLIITDGIRIISKSTYDSLGMPFESGLHKEVDGDSSGLMEAVVGVSPLPRLKNPKRKSKEVQCRKLDTCNSQRSRKLSHSLDSPDGMLIFFLGINIGVISTIISNRREVDKLNSMLKHTENLVQDLQEELEMKESLTVKELANEASERQELNDSYANMEETIDSLQTQVPASYFPAQETDEYDQLHLPKALENSESMSKIEAELEAELERLELNMNITSLEGRMSALGELDPDFIAEVVHGDLRADMLDQGAREGQADDANRESSSTSTTHNTNYAVSPRQLSLRLHEVIEFRLEERIDELERALHNSQKQLQFMEAEQVVSLRAFSNSDMGSSSNQESPSMVGRDSTLAHPLCLNLAEDAPIAYDEAYEEFMRMANTEEILPGSARASRKLYEDGHRPSDRSLIWGMEGSSEGKSSTDTKCYGREQGSNDGGESGDDDEEDDTEDEEGKMLIKQIVERTRQGSPVLIHAQRMLFSMMDG